MWTPPALWNHPVDGFEHFEVVENGVEEGVDLGSGIKDFLLLSEMFINVVLLSITTFVINVIKTFLNCVFFFYIGIRVVK